MTELSYTHKLTFTEKKKKRGRETGGPAKESIGYPYHKLTFIKPGWFFLSSISPKYLPLKSILGITPITQTSFSSIPPGTHHLRITILGAVKSSYVQDLI